ncbi:hypothetical protein RQP46_004274 [Phenoliferia psychrophenolica]
MANTVHKLRKSFQYNRYLLPLVRRLEATAVDQWGWIEHTADNPDHPEKEPWLADYCERNWIPENSSEFRHLQKEYEESEDGPGEAPVDAWEGDMRDEWKQDMRTAALEEWDKAGHGDWKANEDALGELEFLDIVGSAPALRTLVVRGFTTTLHPTTMKKRGPYPLIEALETPDDSPFIDNRTLASLLASRTPNLRSLSGSMRRWSPDGTKANPIPPSLTRLKVTGYDYKDSRINTLLLQAQPNLRSLTLSPAAPGWASSPTLRTLLSSLETFVVDYPRLEDDVEETDALILALSFSSLRHIELVPASTTLFSFLPPSLRSITLMPIEGSRVNHFKQMEGTLEMLKKASTQPLRVEFAVRIASWREAMAARDEWRDDYAAEGHTVATRYVLPRMYF